MILHATVKPRTSDYRNTATVQFADFPGPRCVVYRLRQLLLVTLALLRQNPIYHGFMRHSGKSNVAFSAGASVPQLPRGTPSTIFNSAKLKTQPITTRKTRLQQTVLMHSWR